VKTIDLIPPSPNEGISLEGIEAYYFKRGIEVRWRAPQPNGIPPRLDLSKVPTAKCPGCDKLVKRHDVHWRRARLSMGRLGKFMPVCRKCEDHQAGYACRECKKHRAQSKYRIVSESGSRKFRARICSICEAKPLEERTIGCSRCGAQTTRGESHKGWCKACQKAYSAAREALKERVHTCMGCGAQKPSQAFPEAPSGRRRRYCEPCFQAGLERTHETCGSCRQSLPVGAFASDPKAPFGRKLVCRKCTSRVTAYKARRKRQLAKLAK
jgi:hypothetical protein